MFARLMKRNIISSGMLKIKQDTAQLLGIFSLYFSILVAFSLKFFFFFLITLGEMNTAQETIK